MRSRSKPAKQPTDTVNGTVHAAELIHLPKWPMIALMVLYFLLAALYDHFVPFVAGPEAVQMIQSGTLATNPDEAAHVQNAIKYRGGHIPVFKTGAADFEAHQPPLYYALAAPLVNPRPGVDRPADAARWLSILLGGLLIWVAFAAIREAFPLRPYLAVAVAAFVGLLPMNVNLCASINNDVLANLVVATGFWQLIRIARISRDFDTRKLLINSPILGVIVGLGILTKTSTLVLAPTIGVAAWLLWKSKLLSSRAALSFAACSLGLGLLIGLPWMIRNTELYGDPLAQHIFVTAFQNTATTQRMLEHMSLSQYVVLDTLWTFDSFWGVFDSMQLFLKPNLIYVTIAILSLLSLGGLARAWRRETSDPVQRIAVTLAATLLICTLAAFARFNMVFFQAQGRYLYTALAPIGLFFVMGLSNLVPRCAPNDDSRIAVYLGMGLVLLNVISLYFLSAYQPSS